MAKRQATAVEGNAARRLRWREEDARAVLAAWAGSGESVAAFASRHGLVAQRLFRWRRRLGVEATAAAASPTFVPVTVRASREPVGGTAPLVVTIAGDRMRVEVHDIDASTAAWVATLARARGAEET